MRLPWLDNLRLLAGLAVVTLHVSGFAFRAPGDGTSAAWLWANLYNSGSRWCVAMFVMISGWLLLDPRRTEDGGTFLRKRLVRILPAVAAWPVIYMAYTHAVSGRPENLRTAVGAMVWRGDAFYHLWFLYMIALLYLLTPLLRRWRRAVTPRAQVISCVLLFAVSVRLPAAGGETIGPLLPLPPQPAVLTRGLPFVAYYLLGGLLAARPAPRRLWPWGLGLAAVTAATVAGAAWRVQAAGRPAAAHALQVDLAPGVIVMTLALFQLARGRPTLRLAGRWQSRLADAVFGIYLIHPLVIAGVWSTGYDLAVVRPAVGIPLTTLLVFALAWGCTRCLQAVPLLRRIV